ncbi:His Kinase domain containing protein [Salix suchowensis]|nr:His Kinase domain containing protein [Salix suchowensis]
MASHTTHTLQTTAAALRWAGSFVDISPLALPSPEHELTDPMRGALTAVPRSHPPPDQHLPSSPSLFHHQRHPSFPTSPSATSASASSSSNTPSAPSSHGHHSSGIYTPGGSRARLSSFWKTCCRSRIWTTCQRMHRLRQTTSRPRISSYRSPSPVLDLDYYLTRHKLCLVFYVDTDHRHAHDIPHDIRHSHPDTKFPPPIPRPPPPSHSISLSDNPLPSASRRAHLTRQSSSPLPQPVQPSPHHLSLSLTGGELGSQGSHGIPLHLQQILADQRTRNDESTRIVQTQSPVPFNGDDVSGNDSDVVDENEYALDTDSTDTDSNGDGEHANARVTGAPGPDSVIVFPSMTEARSTSTLLPALPVAEREGEERGSKEGKGKEKYREGGGDGERKDVEKDKQEEGEKEKEQANGSVGEGGDDNLEGQRDAESGTKDADGNTSIFASPVPLPILQLTSPNQLYDHPNEHLERAKHSHDEHPDSLARVVPLARLPPCALSA